MEFNDRQQVLISSLESQLQLKSDTDVANFEPLLALSAEELELEAHEALSRLEELKVDELQATKRTKAAWTKLREFFETKSQILQTHRILPIVYGSIIFDDPKHLDYDVLLVTGQDNEQVAKLELSWEPELDEQWRSIGSPGHIDYLSMERLRGHAKTVGSKKFSDPFAIDSDFKHASIVLAGLPLGDGAVSYRQEIWSLAQENPVLMAYVTLKLKETIALREVRRAGVG